jgi:hypothetical protein
MKRIERIRLTKIKTLKISKGQKLKSILRKLLGVKLPVMLAYAKGITNSNSK